MYKDIERKILLNPGPATTTDTVKMAQVVPDICPREEEFGNLLCKIRKDLLKVVNASEKEYTTVLFGGSGTAVMEATIASVVPPNKKLLIIVNGAYGNRMCQIAETYSIPFLAVESAYGTPINFNVIEKTLQKHQDISSMAMVHHETTTGILNCINTFVKIGKKYNQVLVLDAISSYAGLSIDINHSPVDYLLTSSNKCLQGMAGVGIVICNKEKLELLKSYPSRTFYLDLYSQYLSLEKKRQTRFTPPVQTIYSLQQAINELFIEGIETRVLRYKENYKTLKNGLIQMGLSIFTKGATESGILLTVYEPKHTPFNFKKLHDILYDKGFTIYPGKILNEKTFRLSIIGDLKNNDIETFIVKLKQAITTI